MTIIAYVSLLAAALLGGLVGIFFQKSESNRLLKWILPFSGAFLLGISVLHMLPEAYVGMEGSHRIGLFILLGYLLQIILEFLSKGVEHGHVHIHKEKGQPIILSVMLGLCLHAFLEGMPIENLMDGHAGHEHRFIQQPYLLGILFHKIPAAIALSIILVQYGMKTGRLIFLLVLFSLMSPLGSIVTAYLDLSMEVRKSILALAIGTILHVATVIIFEMDGNFHHKVSLKKVLALLLGFALSMLSIL